MGMGSAGCVPEYTHHPREKHAGGLLAGKKWAIMKGHLHQDRVLVTTPAPSSARPYYGALFAVVVWGASFIATKIALHDVGTMTVVWLRFGIGFLVLLMAFNATLPLLIPPEWLGKHALLPGHRLGVLGGVLVGYPLVALANALIHRLMHRINAIWRWTHQLHHAPLRVDMGGAALFHPFDILQNILFSLLVSTLVLGLRPEAAAWTGFVAAFYGLFQHWNVRTPRWLGYLIQRPESHCIHHQRRLHAYNFSDFPLWDLLMGSFRNPARWEGEAGFDPPAASRYGAMLLGRDVNPGLANGAASGQH